MYPVPQLLLINPPPTLLATWVDQRLDVDDPTEVGTEGRKCCTREYVTFLNLLKHAQFSVDHNSNPRSSIVKNEYYRLDIQRRGTEFFTLAIQSNGPNSKTVCNLYISIHDIRTGFIGSRVIKEAFRHMFKTRKYKRGGHMTVYKNDARGTPKFSEVVFMWGRPNNHLNHFIRVVHNTSKI